MLLQAHISQFKTNKRQRIILIEGSYAKEHPECNEKERSDSYGHLAGQAGVDDEEDDGGQGAGGQAGLEEEDDEDDGLHGHGHGPVGSGLQRPPGPRL